MDRIDPAERELLTAHVLKKDRTWVIAHPETPMTKIQRRRLNNLITRRRRGQPLAYLVGHQAFYGRDFFVQPGVLIPRPETEHLIEAALKQLPRSGRQTVADIGSGSGCISVTIAGERPSVHVIAVDPSLIARHVTRQNAQRHHVQNRVKIMAGDLLIPLLRRNIQPDLVLANLPYLKPSEIKFVAHEPRRALVSGRDGLAHVRRFFQQAKRFKKQPAIMLEIDPRRTRPITSLAAATFPNAKIQILPDLAGRERIVTVNQV